ncbi:uncharacterized protein VTP21DRAFT_336 [Calcarisporiella thermophila]|uniref:uncharacterized protein n=1 Tax=Calcarisporiella thermophila TaxID=911321 RepID=UPI00374330DA
MTLRLKNTFHKLNPLHSDTRNLQILLQDEKDFLATLNNAAFLRRSSAKHIATWGKDEGEDMADVTAKMGELMLKMADIQEAYAKKYEVYRTTLKNVRIQENSMHDLRERHKSLISKINVLKKKAQNQPQPRLPELEAELQTVEQELLVKETELSDFKRYALKEAAYLFHGAALEFAQKTAIVAEYGKYVADVLNTTPTIPGQPRPRYEYTERTTQVVASCTSALDNWFPPAADVGFNPSSSSNLSQPPRSPLHLDQQFGSKLKVANDGSAPSQEYAEPDGQYEYDHATSEIKTGESSSPPYIADPSSSTTYGWYSPTQPTAGEPAAAQSEYQEASSYYPASHGYDQAVYTQSPVPSAPDLPPYSSYGPTPKAQPSRRPYDPSIGPAGIRVPLTAEEEKQLLAQQQMAYGSYHEPPQGYTSASPPPPPPPPPLPPGTSSPATSSQSGQPTLPPKIPMEANPDHQNQATPPP